MKWQKQGKIFTPQDYKLPMGCTEFAQSPQALVLPDRVRIYFSTRARDAQSGKFLSHVAFVDMNRSLSAVIEVSAEPVIPLGELGCFDEHGIFPFSVTEHEGRITAYTCGWSRRSSVSVETATGFAESSDGGRHFQKYGTGPVFGSSLYEPFLVGDSFVRFYDGQYHMWYMLGTKWVRESEGAAPDRVYKIGHAVSPNGVDHWVRDGRLIVPDVLHENECQALPTVLFHDGLYHMYFCFRDVFGFRHDRHKAYRIGYAWSADLTHWTRDDTLGGLTVSESGWDSDMVCYPHIFRVGDRVYLLYNGNEFGRYGFGVAQLVGGDM